MKKDNRQLRLVVALILATLLAFFVTAPALADQVSGDSPVSISGDVSATSPEDVPGSGAPASSYADVLGAQGAPAECPLDEDAVDSSDDLTAQIPGSEDVTGDPAALADGSDVPGSSASGLPAGADLAPRTAAADEEGESADESPETAAELSEEETVEQPLLLAADPKAASAGHWEVTSNRGHGLQRYWIDAAGNVAKGRLVSPEEGSGWWAYARPEGYVVRGKYVAKDGKVYLANNDGRLENPGWVVTSKYDGGLQRYWIDESAHAAVPGYSTDGWTHYTLPDKGYVARGSFTDAAGRKMTADNDGRVKGGIPKKLNGWVVSSAFGHGLQRYWFRNDVMSKSELLPASETGWWAYARPEGYVVRGKYVAKDGKVYLANNDGRLENPGWVVTSKYGDGLQRYWIDSSAHAAVPGYSTAGWAHYTLPNKGYVARGKASTGDGYVIFANNDGKVINEKAGWLVTKKYDGHNERYWIENRGGYTAAKTGLFKVSGKQYYGLEGRGYVLRNDWKQIGSSIYTANNDGVLRQDNTYLDAARRYSSATNYFLLIDSNKHKVAIFTWAGNDWVLTKLWGCSTGKPSSPTVKGLYTVGGRGYSFGDSDHTCYYWTQIYGGYLFHSVLYIPGSNMTRYRDDRIGYSISAGCVRLAIENAKWIHDNVPSGSRIYSF